MTTVDTILRGKGNEVWSVRPDTLVYDALALMAEKNIGALMVLEANDVVGVFSERDYARRVVLLGRHPRESRVGEVMTKGVISVTPGQSIEECMSLMTQKRIRHLPVIESERLVGIISMRDVVSELVDEKQRTIEHLENYITGAR